MNLAVFLLAGRGSRLEKYTEIIPKCLVEVSGTPILHRMLDILVNRNIRKVILVVGYRWEDIFNSVGDNWKGIEIQYVINHNWSKTNNIVSFYLAKEHIKDNFLLIEGDVVISQNALNEFCNGGNQMAVSKYQSNLDGTVVTLNDNKLVEHIYLKTDINANLDLNTTYKTVNIYNFNYQNFLDLIIPAFESIINKGEVNAYYEQALANLVNNKKIDFEVVDYSNTKWYEIDNEQDLQIAETLFPK